MMIPMRIAGLILGGWAGLGSVRAQQSVPGLEVTTLEVEEPLASAGRLGGVSLDASGNVYVSNFGASLWRVSPDGTVTKLADGLRETSGNTVLPDGRLLQASFLDNRVVEVAADGTVTTVVGEGLDGPVGVVGDAAGRVFVCNCRGNSVTMAQPDGVVRTLASGGPLDCPNGITVAPDGDAYVVSFNNAKVVRISADDGAMQVVAELPEGRNAHIAFAGDALWVTRIATGELYHVALDGSARRVVGASGIGLRDGPAETAQLAHPNGIAASPDGRFLYLNDLVGPWHGDEPTEMKLRRVGPIAAHDQEIEVIQIPVGAMVFEARAAGPDDGPLVLLLHGFPETSYAFRHQLRALAAAGYRAVAPDQRGYSPGARPDGVAPYAMTNLTDDVAAIADALGAERFDLVGHDWGGAVAWVVATRFPGRVRTLTVLSTPHYAALSSARAQTGSDQAQRSSYFTDFAAPGAETRFLADDAAYLRSLWGDLDPEAVGVYMDALGNPEALRAALAWYGAAFGGAAAGGSGSGGAATGPPPAPTPVQVPTLYVWSTEDTAFGRGPAEATRDFVSGPYRFEVIEGVDHWIAERVPERVNRLILEQLRAAGG